MNQNIHRIVGPHGFPVHLWEHIQQEIGQVPPGQFPHELLTLLVLGFCNDSAGADLTKVKVGRDLTRVEHVGPPRLLVVILYG